MKNDDFLNQDFRPNNIAKICFFCCAICILNFILFAVITGYLGGDALNGYHTNQQYYVCYRGSCTPVAKQLWNISYIQAKSIFITHPLAAIFLMIGFSNSIQINQK